MLDRFFEVVRDTLSFAGEYGEDEEVVRLCRIYEEQGVV